MKSYLVYANGIKNDRADYTGIQQSKIFKTDNIQSDIVFWLQYLKDNSHPFYPFKFIVQTIVEV